MKKRKKKVNYNIPMHKTLTRIVALLLISVIHGHSVLAKDGYSIQLKFTDIKDSTVYLAHYFGKPLPTIYKTDSAKIDKNGNAILKSDTKILGGIYLILLSDKKTYFDFLLDNGKDMSITVTVKDLPSGLQFKNSEDNNAFVEYGRYLLSFSKKQQDIEFEYNNAKTANDSAIITKKLVASAEGLNNYRKDYVSKSPNALLAKIFNALSMPTVPTGPHYLSDGKTNDSSFAYRYYKTHYWDGFDFSDDRLIHTPIYDIRLDEYINKLTYPHEDSVIKECKFLLQKTAKSPELFKYSLWWLTYNAENSKIMGMDAVFVYLVENYYMKGYAIWLTPEELEKYISSARKIAPNVIGNIAPDIKLTDANGKEQTLHTQKAKYTVLVFWSPDCGHCKEEMPKIDSLYRAVLKKKGVSMYAVSTYDEEKLWKDYIKEHKLEEWVHVWDPKRLSNFRHDYNVYMTPIIYVLDEKKIIRAKRIDYSNIAGLLEALEKKK
ncbi:hypothetical protein CAP35_10230 [Chitinophagaceae bacterium IBVUCB1]|nr:hypothetical protein CAP35_10230 [Chitinophagaceae bacterium IBVUCB1]